MANRLKDTTVNGVLIVSRTSGESNLRISGPTGTNRALYFSTSGVARWLVIADSKAESGTDGGSNFALLAYSDSGSYIDSPISIVRRANGVITLSRPVTTTGDVTVGGDLTVGGGELYAAAGTNLHIRAASGGLLRFYSGNGTLSFSLNPGDGNCYYNVGVYGPGKNIGNNNARWKQIYTEIGDFSGRVSMSGLPTSDAGLNAGDLWNDNGTVKIKT